VSELPPLRVGVIGCGRIAQVAHLPAATKATGVELVGVCDASPRLAAAVGRRYGVPGTTTVDTLLDLDLDLVVVATPDRFHLEHASKALESGRHVLVEKPLASTLMECRELTALAHRKGCKLQVGAMKRHDPGIRFAHDALDRIGPIRSVSCWYRVMSALRPPTEATLFPDVIVDPDVRAHEATFKADRERYLLVTHGVHVFDGLRYLAGDLGSISARVANVGADYTWHGRGELVASGGLASFEISANVHADWSEGFDIFGELGALKVRSWFPFYRRASLASLFVEASCEETTPYFGDADPYELQLEAFVASIRGDTRPNPDGVEGGAAVAMVEATADSSAGAGRVVAL